MTNPDNIDIGIDANERGETLEIDAFLQLAMILEKEIK